MRRTIYRSGYDDIYYKIFPDGSVLEIDFRSIKVDVSVSFSKNPGVIIPNEFSISKELFEEKYREAMKQLTLKK